ncbi:hypothetical protein GCM10022402_02030 [Salinactinospora qingdaonensis]|uniref:Uncharacterized protein n=1 Tax=Salinactinospora qingdaonensis TaxID=702744 RepID=A0ABP7EXE9_9ACTN
MGRLGGFRRVLSHRPTETPPRRRIPHTSGIRHNGDVSKTQRPLFFKAAEIAKRSRHERTENTPTPDTYRTPTPARQTHRNTPRKPGLGAVVTRREERHREACRSLG